MQRNAAREPQIGFVMTQLGAFGEGAPGADEKLALVAAVRACSPEMSNKLDRALVEHVTQLRAGVHEVQEQQDKLRALLEKMAAPPWHPAIYLGAAPTSRGTLAMVLHGAARRIVTFGEGIDPDALGVGDEVLLGAELNVIMAASTYVSRLCGETAQFERYLEDGRLVLKLRDEEVVVWAARDLSETRLRAGEEVRFDRAAWLAFEKIERSRGEQFFLEETPSETFADVGGLDREVEELQRTITLHLNYPEIVRRRRLPRKKAVLLYGPPGTGKTLLARALANWLAKLSKSGRARFINVKPGGLNSMWYGETERHYREVFRIAREAGELEPDVPVVIFFDEVDSVGGGRGASWHRVDDRVLNAFMAELNGLENRGNILVVTATNRRDMLDPALVRPGRLGDLVLRVPRPNRKAARDIFEKHLDADLQFAHNGHDSAAAREHLVGAAIARIYSANQDAELAVLTFRDGKRRTVRAAELISGAEIAKIAQAANERSSLREARGGSASIEYDDVMSGVADFFETASTVLTPANCRQHLDDLPQDVDVTRVDPVQRKVARPHRYLKVA